MNSATHYKTPFVLRLIPFAATLFAGGLAHAASSPADPPRVAPAPTSNIDEVDPFIGTAGPGNVYPGATLPFGFIQVGPDTGAGSGAGGYKFDKPIDGFSQQHISGMGGPVLGEFSIFPLTGALENPSSIASTGKSAEAASPGYYTVTLAPWNVKVELTATKHVALHRHTFPASAEARILIDVGHCLFGTGKYWLSAEPVGGEVTVNAARQEVSGYMVYEGGRSTALPWKAFFVARFDTPFDSFATWDDAGKVSDGVAHLAGKEIGAALNFKTTDGQVINSKIGVSWRSIEQARDHLTAETPGWDFDQTHQQARTIWAEALDKIQVEGGTADQRRQFYTALYRMHVTPNDWTGESPERYGDRTYYENILCMWDTFRTVNPMLTLIQPKVNADIVNSIINYQQVDGWTGDAHSVHQYEHVQNGSHADSIIADAYVKGLPGVDWKQAYAAIRKNAFEDADPNTDQRPKLGRFHLDDYRHYHYLPTDIVDSTRFVQGVSRTLEYVYNDFCVLALAKKYGSPEDVADLNGRLLWYQNLWDKSSGFMRGKTKDGSWYAPFGPMLDAFGKPYVRDAGSMVKLTGRQYYEGLAWTWSWYVPHDAQGLINLNGGPTAFVERLTTACDEHYEAYNEPGMLQTVLFIHAGRPDKTQFFMRKALANFTSAKDGLPGNDDSGTTSGWLVWNLLGLYPNAGQDYYYIGSPSFTKSTMHLPGGKTLVIDAPAASPENKYIASAKLDGKPWNRAWLRHSDFIDGAVLELAMTDKPTDWGTKDLPPSVSK